MELIDKVIFVWAFTIFESGSHVNCLHLTPPPSPCRSPVRPFLTGNAIPNSQSHSPFALDAETDPSASGQKTFGTIMPPAFVSEDDTSAGYQSEAYGCSLLPCLREEPSAAVCACNLNTGNVVTFKSSCDVQRHNCRFATAFKVILNEICPWEFESRRSNKQPQMDYKNPKYYNK